MPYRDDDRAVQNRSHQLAQPISGGPPACLDDVECITLHDLEAKTVIALPTTSSGRQALDTAALRTQQTVRVDIEANSGAVAQALAAAGRGIALVTDDPRFDPSRSRSSQTVTP